MRGEKNDKDFFGGRALMLLLHTGDERLFNLTLASLIAKAGGSRLRTNAASTTEMLNVP